MSQRPRKPLGSYFRDTSNTPAQPSPTPFRKPAGSYLRTPGSEPLPPSPEDTQPDIPEQVADTIEPIQASEDEFAAFLRQLDVPPARERQPEAQWQQDPQEPERYQPAQGQSRLGRDIQTGDYVDVTHASRRQGLYLIGLQGYGKSGLMENLVIQDIKQHIGVCVLNPHGELVDHVIERLPDKKKEKKVILLDLAEEDFFFGLNLFTCRNPDSPKAVQKVVDQVMHIFEKLFSISRTTPQMAYYLRNCTRTIIANPGCTMAEIPLLLTDEGYRSRLIATVTDPQVRLFWQQYERLKPSEKDEKASPILNKLDEFLQPLPRNIIGQSSSTIDLQQIMDEGKILLVKLDRQLEQLTSLIGSILVALILNASATRKTHNLFNLYADEFQNFATEDFAVLLEQARKKDIGVTMAHQNRGQLELSEKQADASLKKRTLSVGGLVVFRVPTDADELAGQFPHEPEEAREEELEKESLEVRKPQKHQRIEEQIEIEVEEEIQAISQNPVDFLVSARGTHGSEQVRLITQEYLAQRFTGVNERYHSREKAYLTTHGSLILVDSWQD